ncbi:MAG: hypothetical protein R3F23_01955 [Verrucomicrobiia bacterium]
MGKDDLAKKRGGRLKTAFDQQAANQLRVEFVDKNFNPINTINISPGDSSLVPESGYLSPEAQEIAWVYDGYNTLTTLSLHFELGRLIPQDIQASENPKLPLYAEIAFRDTVTDESVNLHSLSPSFILDTITNHKKIEL